MRIVLPKKVYLKRTHCKACECLLIKENIYTNQGIRDSRCLDCRRKNMKRINDKRYKTLKENKW